MSESGLDACLVKLIHGVKKVDIWCKKVDTWCFREKNKKDHTWCSLGFIRKFDHVVLLINYCTLLLLHPSLVTKLMPCEVIVPVR